MGRARWKVRRNSSSESLWSGGLAGWWGARGGPRLPRRPDRGGRAGGQWGGLGVLGGRPPGSQQLQVLVDVLLLPGGGGAQRLRRVEGGARHRPQEWRPSPPAAPGASCHPPSPVHPGARALLLLRLGVRVPGGHPHPAPAPAPARLPRGAGEPRRGGGQGQGGPGGGGGGRVGRQGLGGGGRVERKGLGRH